MSDVDRAGGCRESLSPEEEQLRKVFQRQAGDPLVEAIVKAAVQVLKERKGQGVR